MTDKNDDSKVLKLTNWIIDKAVEGLPPLSSAEDLAMEYKIDEGYKNDDERVDSLINWETSKNFTTGFIAGLGGLITLPVSISSALAASWVIQARMVGAIAGIYGHKLEEDRVRTMMLLSLLGDMGKEVIKSAGIKVGQKITANMIKKIPGKVLIEINKKVGFRLITKAGEKGVINIAKGVPIVGGVVGGTFDAVTCKGIGYSAKSIFKK